MVGRKNPSKIEGGYKKEKVQADGAQVRTNGNSARRGEKKKTNRNEGNLGLI